MAHLRNASGAGHIQKEQPWQGTDISYQRHSYFFRKARTRSFDTWTNSVSTEQQLKQFNKEKVPSNQKESTSNF